MILPPSLPLSLSLSPSPSRSRSRSSSIRTSFPPSPYFSLSPTSGSASPPPRPTGSTPRSSLSSGDHLSPSNCAAKNLSGNFSFLSGCPQRLLAAPLIGTGPPPSSPSSYLGALVSASQFRAAPLSYGVSTPHLGASSYPP